MNAVLKIPSVEIAQGPSVAYSPRFAGIVQKAEVVIQLIGEVIDAGYTLNGAISFGKTVIVFSC